MDHIIQFINIELVSKDLQRLYFNFQPSIVKLTISLMN